MNTIIIYGAWSFGKTILEKVRELENSGEDIIFADRVEKLWGTEVMGIPVINPADIPDYNYCKVIVGTLGDFEEIVDELENVHLVPKKKIDITYAQHDYDISMGARNRFLPLLAETTKQRGLKGSCAEVGVLNGDFAKRINRAFPESTLYLFDTFEGFDARDIVCETDNGFSNSTAGGYASAVTIDVILNKMPYPNNVLFRKGYFPETASGIEDEFVLVNLDVDLYKPTLAGLEFFYPKMVKGGVILVHDYWRGIQANESDAFRGIKPAVAEFCCKYDIPFIPISDAMSIAVIKY